MPKVGQNDCKSCVCIISDRSVSEESSCGSVRKVFHSGYAVNAVYRCVGVCECPSDAVAICLGRVKKFPSVNAKVGGGWKECPPSVLFNAKYQGGVKVNVHPSEIASAHGEALFVGGVSEDRCPSVTSSSVNAESISIEWVSEDRCPSVSISAESISIEWVSEDRCPTVSSNIESISI